MQNNEITELYLIRHAETVLNTNPHLVNGRSNHTPLTDRGIEQAKHLGRAMFEKNIIPNAVFASPALRTIQTAHYSLDEMKLDISPIIQDELQEISQGEMEGQPRAEVYTKEVLADIKAQGKDFKLEGGESMNDVAYRISRWLTSTFTEDLTPKSGKYFIYTHGGAIKYFASHLLGWDQDQTYKSVVGNATVNLFTIDNGLCEVQYLNREPTSL